MGLDVKPETATALTALAAAEGLSVDEYLQRLVQKKLPAKAPRASSIVENMRALRANVKPDPEGWSVRDYINYGRR